VLPAKLAVQLVPDASGVEHDMVMPPCGMMRHCAGPDVACGSAAIVLDDELEMYSEPS
jgi:hypothetical protein